MNKTSLTLNVQCETATGKGGSFWVWPKSRSWKQGRILSLLLKFGLELDAMCNTSLPAYPPAPQRLPSLGSLGSLSFPSAFARAPLLTGVTSYRL